MDLQQYLADISLKIMSQIHRAIVHLTGGQVLGSAFGMPVAGRPQSGLGLARKPSLARTSSSSAACASVSLPFAPPAPWKPVPPARRQRRT